MMFRIERKQVLLAIAYTPNVIKKNQLYAHVMWNYNATVLSLAVTPCLALGHTFVDVKLNLFDLISILWKQTTSYDVHRQLFEPVNFIRCCVGATRVYQFRFDWSYSFSWILHSLL